MSKKKVKPIVETKLKETIYFDLLNEIGVDFLPQLYKKLGKKVAYFDYYTKIVDFLNKAGFKMFHPLCHVDKQGRVFNTLSGRFMSLNVRNTVNVKGLLFNIPKTMLYLFKGESIRKLSQIMYSDGNRNNLNINNIDYIREFPSEKIVVDYKKLMLCLRCYNTIPVNHVVTDWVVTKAFLQITVEKSDFFTICECFISPGFKVFTYTYVFRHWLYNPLATFEETAKEFGLSEHDCNYVINSHLESLINTVLYELKQNKVEVKPLHKPPSKNVRKAFREFENLKAEILPDYKQKPYPEKNIETALAEFAALKAEIEAEMKRLKSKE